MKGNPSFEEEIVLLDTLPLNLPHFARDNTNSSNRKRLIAWELDFRGRL